MKSHWHAFSVVVLLVIAVPLLLGSVAPSSQEARSVNSLKAALSKAGFLVQDGELASYDPTNLCCTEGSTLKCMYNNVNAPYLCSTSVPLGPGEPAMPLLPNNFHLGQNEALILVGQTPPPVAYFSYTVFLGTRRTTRFPYNYGNFTMMNGYVADSINNLTIHTSGPPKDPYNREILLFIVASLRSFEFFTGFGEAFQYSNQMVATGGYLAALAGGGHSDDLYGAYLEQMQERVFDPIGMPNTTFDFDEVTASPDYAIPHGANALHEFSPVPVSSERVLIPVAPAGAAWSNARDMARYLITELNEGVSPDGVRVVSAENLRVTWEPQVPVAAETSYGLGWFVDHYQGLPLLHHGGNTAGFTTDLAFLPGADLGIVVITNARLSNYFNEAVRFRLFELAFDQPAEHHAQFQFALESLAKADQDLSLELLPGADPEAVAPYLGTFSNPALGDMTLSMTGDHLMMDAGEFATELRPRVDADGRTTYIMYGPLWAGYVLEFKQGPDGGEPSIVVLSPPDKYVFTRK